MTGKTSNLQTIKYGFNRGVALTFLYATVFVLYAIIRSSRTILNQLAPDEGLYNTLFANASSILISSLGITTLVSLSAGLLGMVTASIIQWLIKMRDRGYAYFHPRLTGFIASLFIAVILQVLLFTVTGFSWMKSSPDAYWFWFGFPTVVYIIAGSTWSDKFYKRLIQPGNLHE